MKFSNANSQKIKKKEIKKLIPNSVICEWTVSVQIQIKTIRSMTLSKVKRYQGYQGQKIINQEINKAGQVVRAFLEEDKNSRLCPGKRDTITRHKTKTLYQRYYEISTQRFS